MTLLRSPGRIRSAAVWTGVVVAALAAAPLVSPSIDDLYALAWGGELYRGRVPDIAGPLLPTAHPLNTLASAALAPLGPPGARHAFSAISLIALAVLVHAAFRLGRRIGGLTAAVVAAVLVASRPQIEIWGWAAVVDIPFAALVLLAAALAAEGPEENRWKVLGLLLAAGLARPEGWVLSVIYAAWLITRESRARVRAALVAMALAAPVIWGVFDLVLAGNPVFAFTSAKGSALSELGSADFFTQEFDPGPSGPARVATALPRVIGWPLLAVGAVAGVTALARFRRRAGPVGSAEGVEAALALAALGGCTVFVALNLIGLPAHPRYLLVPGVALVILAAGTIRWARTSRRVAWGLGAALIAMLALLPFDVAYLVRNLDEEHERLVAARGAEDAVSGEYATSVVALCPRLVVGGTRRRFAHAGRAATAAQLRRDPSEVLLRRLPRTPPGTSAIAYQSYAGARAGTWRFTSACSGLLHVLPPAIRAADATARAVVGELRR